MGDITKARLALLEEGIKSAVVTDVGEGNYSVFVPGAVREYNVIRATDEADAIAKVKTVLIQKTNDYPETSTGHVVIQPRSIK